ncbi:MAG: peptide deformylase [Candidatus Wallbacteria bacterium HGW-Wallbacteria-1]|jgi:peptide deformylase|uniref:Peptide deformylase n=1 Tax=Candidatus Wallbacteria bacterium HGW-Wallbacteria-1 TaxID=2013854 RepID=A0A2N1PUF8_9BACT|nr:MAG: peptide deformylase [Candidatus Wallbacteria bacterium HGW-Wallbacteria-1]
MVPFEIVTYGDPILQKKSDPIVNFDDEIREVARRMLLTMYEEPGVGLAAPQVGLNIRLVVMDSGSGPRILVNPEILFKSDETDIMEEGCLSFPGIQVEVERSLEVEYRADIEIFNGQELTSGETRHFSEFEARILQHETDHLDGVFFVDRTIPLHRAKIRKNLEKLRRQTMVRLGLAKAPGRALRGAAR